MRVTPSNSCVLAPNNTRKEHTSVIRDKFKGEDRLHFPFDVVCNMMKSIPIFPQKKNCHI